MQKMSSSITWANKESINFLFTEIQTCGAVLSAFELCEALNQYTECNIISEEPNQELEKYFNIKTYRKPPKGIKITFTPRIIGDYAYIRTKDGRWLNHREPKIAVSKFISDWIKADTIIGNGTHKRFKDLKLKRDIDCLIEGNYEPNKNIDETIKEAKKYGKVVWFGRTTTDKGIEHISNPSLDEIVNLYNRSKVFLKMSKCEGWNRPVAEATACGCKVINKSGGNQDIEIQSWDSIAKQLIKHLNENI